MKKIRPVKNTWYDWLIIYIAEPMTKSGSSVNDKTVSALKDKTLNALKGKTVTLLTVTVYGRGQKLSNAKERFIKKPFISEEKKGEIKYRIIRDIWKVLKLKKNKNKMKDSLRIK